MFRRPQDEEATLADASEPHFAIHHAEEVTEPIDPRIAPAEVATPEQLDESYARQFSDYVSHHHHPHSNGHAHEPKSKSDHEDEKKDAQTTSEEQAPSSDEVLYVCFSVPYLREPLPHGVFDIPCSNRLSSRRATLEIL